MYGILLVKNVKIVFTLKQFNFSFPDQTAVCTYYCFLCIFWVEGVFYNSRLFSFLSHRRLGSKSKSAGMCYGFPSIFRVFFFCLCLPCIFGVGGFCISFLFLTEVNIQCSQSWPLLLPSFSLKTRFYSKVIFLLFSLSHYCILRAGGGLFSN